MNTETDLLRWDVPFAECMFPSVILITEPEYGHVSLVVAPSGLDCYPKYIVRFDEVLAVLCNEEAVRLDRGYESLTGLQRRVCCAYLWVDSPWLRESYAYAEVLQWSEPRHYLVFGGDSNVEIIASGEPNIEMINVEKIIETRYEV